MRFDVLTLFPEMVDGVLRTSITGRAADAGYIEFYTHNIRDFSDDPRRRVDDTPYGGGSGMVMQAEPVYRCIGSVGRAPSSRVIYMSPKGRVLTQNKAMELSRLDQLIILCGHYEGIDQRVLDECVDEEISIGDYVLTGGELPACVLVDCVSRMIDGVLAEEASYKDESIFGGLLEYPHYTRPPVWHGKEVPEILKNGDHAKIDEWRYRKSIEVTREKRPDLI
ncbi:MAG: tRNA (guanosine(37)-N1)-methyltransferase TrmD [Clostridia bacterium]|nr:tRNA (guanosine(37)-N1)-methyltransferase TrmD [Clostridia bacterium]